MQEKSFWEGCSPDKVLQAHTAHRLSLLIPAETAGPKRRFLRGEKGRRWIAKSLYWETLAVGSGGRSWLAGSIGSGGRQVSASSQKRSVEQFGGWLHACGAQVGNPRRATADSNGAAPRLCGDGGTGDQSSESVAQHRNVRWGYSTRPRLRQWWWWRSRKE